MKRYARSCSFPRLPAILQLSSGGRARKVRIYNIQSTLSRNFPEVVNFLIPCDAKLSHLVLLPSLINFYQKTIMAEQGKPNGSPGTGTQQMKSMQEVLGEILAMGYDPNSKKNSSGFDYISQLRNDTYEFIDPKQFDLKGRAVFITGASRGIGKALAVSHAKAGAGYIGIGARSSLDKVEYEIQEAAKAAGRSPPKVLALKLDVTDKNSVTDAAKKTEEAFGRLDILINNSGYMEKNVKIVEAEPEDWWRTWEVNIFGLFLMTRAFLPLLLKSHDSLKTIINLSSIWALTYEPACSAYQMSKFAMLRFAQLVTAEYGDQGVLTYSVHPGAVATELAGELPPEIKQFLNDTPELAGDTIVWVSAERREWLANRYIAVNWDMKELEEKKERIVKEDHLKMRMAVGLE